MQVTVNGESCELPEALRADELIERIGLADQRIALEINREIVPRSEYANTTLHEGDRVEIVRAIGGG
ncbi:MAG: sulfur carrier protein ThiS [Halofilum sp. (in: g-proteobacteria)]|nr:sulfur carrier protein ThiS [Halofilum sp. (in: g-proteobacteria)]